MNDCSEYLATAFREVDKSSDLGKVVTCLRFMEGLPSFIAYKRRSIERLHLTAGDMALDLGCGLGFDVPRMARLVQPGGTAVGIDVSQKLLDAASRAFSDIEGIRFESGDIHELPFSSGSFDGVRIDRTLQHVADPQQVISEMVRVLKPGGWLVCAEPDWATFVIDGDPHITELVAHRWRKSFRNPHIGRQLLRRIRAESIQNTWAEGSILLADGLEAVDTVYDVCTTVNKLTESQEVDSDAIENWVHELKARDDSEGLIASVTLFLAGGQKSE